MNEANGRRRMGGGEWAGLVGTLFWLSTVMACGTSGEEVQNASEGRVVNPPIERVAEGTGGPGVVRERLSVSEWPQDALTVTNSVLLGQRAKFKGTVAARNLASGTMLGFNSEVALDNEAVLTGSVRSHRLYLGAEARITGSAAYNASSGTGTIQGAVTTPLSLPLPMIAIPALPSIVPGTQNVTLNASQQQTLAAGRYRDVTLNSGNAGVLTRLTLSGGIYELRRLTIGNDSRVWCASPCEIRVKERIFVDARSFIGPANGVAGMGPGNVEVFVQGTNAVAGPEGMPSAFQLGNDSDLHAYALVPNGTLRLGHRAEATGKIVAQNAVVGIDNTAEGRQLALITDEPDDLTAYVSKSATFSVVATGPDLIYQWQVNGVDIPGATGASYTLATTTLSDTGKQFRVAIRNSAGTVLTDSATLTVKEPVFAMEPSPVGLVSYVETETGLRYPAEARVDAPVTFEIPPFLEVSFGNAGQGLTTLAFETVPTGEIVTCTYRGGALNAHPTSDVDRMLGMRYEVESCSDGSTGGSERVGTWFRLDVQTADDQTIAAKTQVEVHLGPGCSGRLPPPVSPAEVAAMREAFTWATAPRLEVIDPDGFPAIWHGVVYIDQPRQLEALDRMRIFWSAAPLAASQQQNEGKCGLVQHATDGRGVLVYAVFPAWFYNVMREFGRQAELAGTEPPFALIAPSPPDEPEFVNEDGSLDYEGLRNSHFLEWLQTGSMAQPGVFDWVVDNVVDPLVDAVETGIDYTVAGWDNAIDWAANGVDDIWEVAQEGLQEFVLVLSDPSQVKVRIRIMNSDPEFADGPLVRAWGPPADAATGLGRSIVPAGAKVRIRQKGWGFLPVMGQDTIGEEVGQADFTRDSVHNPTLASFGRADVEAVKGAPGRGGTFCIELDASFGSMTTDLIPNEVCQFGQGDFNDFGASDVDANIDIKTTSCTALA